MASVPSGSSTTTGRFLTPSVDTIATWGWLMTGAVMSVPNPPGLVMVNVPPEISSAPSFLVRARLARSAISLAIDRSRLQSASWMTGTMRPSKLRSTAMPRWTARWTMSLSSLDRRVDVREVPDGVDHRPGHERQVGEGEALLLLQRCPCRLAGLVDVGVVDLDGDEHVGRRGLGPHHVLGRAPADVGERDHFVARRATRLRARAAGREPPPASERPPPSGGARPWPPPGRGGRGRRRG